MTPISNRVVGFALATAAGLAVLFAAERISPTQPRFITTADARIGRPMTPMSYAGVARRTTRRAVYVGAGAAAAGAAAAGAAYYSSGCSQAVDAYGRVYTRCP